LREAEVLLSQGRSVGDPAILDLNRDLGEARVVMQETASATKDLKKSFGLDAPGKPPGEQTP
jgi:hypothetical protein